MPRVKSLSRTKLLERAEKDLGLAATYASDGADYTALGLIESAKSDLLQAIRQRPTVTVPKLDSKKKA